MMNDSQKIAALKELLAEQLAWHKEALVDPEKGPDYVYDCVYEQFEMMSRGSLEGILCILNK